MYTLLPKSNTDISLDMVNTREYRFVLGQAM